MKNLNTEAGFDKLSLTTKSTVMLNLFQHPFLKKVILICIRMTAVLLFVSSGLFAQTPQAINYQGVARDNAGKVMATKTVSLRLSILDSSMSGTAIYVEEHAIVQTNPFGIFTLSIGTGIAITGTFANINWAKNPKFLKVEMDPAGSTNYVFMGTSQLLAVPYALYAEKAGNNLKAGSGIKISNDSIINTAQGTQGAKGDKGDKGDQGIKGDTGATGLTGLTGATGNDGVSITNSFVLNDSLFVKLSNGQTLNTGYVRGAKGDKGDKGDTGATGPQGIQGMKGDTGSMGVQGIQGIQGVKGDKGDTGAMGKQGIQGIQGIKGDTGATGLTGANGKDGISIDTTYIKNDSLFVHFSNGQTLNTGYVKGDKGDKGLKGDTGAVGAKGEQGVSIVSSYVKTDTLFLKLSNGQTLNSGYLKGNTVTGGKTYLTFTRDITNTEAAQKILEEGGINTQIITVLNCTNLTMLDFSKLKNLQSISILNNRSLTSVNFKNLVHVDDLLNISNNPALANLNFDSLKFIGGDINISENTNKSFSNLSFPKLTFCASITVENDSVASISFPKLTTISATLYGLNNGFSSVYGLYIAGNKSLNSLNFPILNTIAGNTGYGLTIASNPSLTSISFPLFISCNNGITINGNSKCTSISFPSLPSIATSTSSAPVGLYIQGNILLSSINFPILSTISGYSRGLSIEGNRTLKIVRFPSLEIIYGTSDYGLYISSNDSLNSISFPLLDSSSTGLYINGNNKLTYDSLPSLKYAYNFKVFGNALLSNIYFPSILDFNLIDFTANKLSSSAVNGIISTLVSINPSIKGKSIRLNAQTPKAPPTGQGVTDLATLLGRPNGVVTD